MSLVDDLRTATLREYQRRVLEEVHAGRGVFAWVPLIRSVRDHTVEIGVLARPLAVGTPDAPIYVMCSATLQQLLADEIGGLLPTTGILDEKHRQAAFHFDPADPYHSLLHAAWVVDQTMGTPPRWIEQSDLLAKTFGDAPATALLSDGWKSWVLFRGMAEGLKLEGSEQAGNHGLYSRYTTSVTLSGEHAIQNLGTRHGRLEADESQMCELMSSDCIVDGTVMRTADVLRDETLAWLLSDEGPLMVTRQPGAYDMHAFDPVTR